MLSFLCDIMTHVRLEVQIHSFLNWALDVRLLYNNIQTSNIGRDTAVPFFMWLCVYNVTISEEDSNSSLWLKFCGYQLTLA
jgi:hypothetical protein